MDRRITGVFHRSQSAKTFWRCLHYAEGGDWHELGRPAVHNSESIAGVEFSRSMQLLSFQINSFNPQLTGNKWRSVWANTTAFTNEHGFNIPGDPRVDFVNMLDVGAAYPRVMRGIICSGSLYTGTIEGADLVMYPGVDGVDVNNMPTAAQVLSKHWYFAAVSADLNGASHFAQGGGGVEVRIPLFLKVPTHYPLSWFERWDESYPPNPIEFYR